MTVQLNTLSNIIIGKGVIDFGWCTEGIPVLLQMWILLRFRWTSRACSIFITWSSPLRCSYVFKYCFSITRDFLLLIWILRCPSRRYEEQVKMERSDSLCKPLKREKLYGEEEDLNFTLSIWPRQGPRPNDFVIERSLDNGTTWNPALYLATDCQKAFPGVPTAARLRLDEPHCFTLPPTGADPYGDQTVCIFTG